jgi:asparagine synthase (glutamine-hydrolysing)
VCLEESADTDESAAARLTANAFHCDHASIRIRGNDVVERLPALLSAVDHPSGDGLNTFLVAEAVRDHGLKVALSGLGGDELFGGYPSFRRLARLGAAAGPWRHAPGAVRRTAAALVRTAGSGRVLTEKAASALRTGGTLSELWPVTRQLFAPVWRRELIAARLVPRNENDAWPQMLAKAFADAPGAGVWQEISYAETRCYMHDVLLRDTDQMSMAHGLEVRVPLLDHRLASYVTSLPDAAKRDGPQPKALLLKSLEHPLPPRVSRGPKRGFTLPLDLWMRGPLKEFCAAQLDARGLEGRGVLADGHGLRLWSRFLARERGVTAGRVWPLVALNAWLDRHQVRVP